MNRSLDGTAVQDARQLVRIARIECGQPLERAEALVFGQTPCAAALAEELKDMGTARVTLADGLPAQGESYDLILLLQGMDPERLGAIARPGALVIDACREKNSEWIIHDPSLHYRRIRVISTAGF
ncbi:MAG: hypothetical protein MRZ28_07620 [Oscillospiraceae bacterium]|nr:hypothetical protein [Oscillospiraceae bacterium]MCM0704257.1 hypothetical protein [Faecalicatena sp. BF-R-105]MDY3219581.1 hypothetical protein [Candidatus Fimivivens sp.]SFJ54243.1 hypothetical protein SAMN02910435_02308 [Ruminococcaceae bacterium D5]GKH50721.1 hypothetical protein CE91St46_18320 [Eubacteriales bacterium]